MATKEEIVADLRHLLETDQTRTKMGRIWEIYAEIVELQQGGVSMKNIEALLNARGFALKPGNLTSYLCQIRKKKGIEKVDRTGPRSKKTVLAKPVTAPKAPIQAPKKPVVQETEKPTNPPDQVAKPLTSDEVRESFSKQKDFSRYNTD